MSLQEGEALKWTIFTLYSQQMMQKKLGIKNLNFQVLDTVQGTPDTYAICCLLAEMGFIHTPYNLGNGKKSYIFKRS